MPVPIGEYIQDSDLGTVPKTHYDFKQALCFDRNGGGIQGFIVDSFDYSANWVLNAQIASLGNNWHIQGQAMAFGPSVNVTWGSSSIETQGEVLYPPFIVTDALVTGDITPDNYHDIFYDTPAGSWPDSQEWTWAFNNTFPTMTTQWYRPIRGGTYSCSIDVANSNNGFNKQAMSNSSTVRCYIVSLGTGSVQYEIASYNPLAGTIINLPEFVFSSAHYLGNSGSFTVKIVCESMGLSQLDDGDTTIPGAIDWRTDQPTGLNTPCGIDFAGYKVG